MFLKNTPRLYPGFTLIELMVVIAIISILSSLSMSSYETYKQNARKSEAYVGVSTMNKNQKLYYMGGPAQFASDGMPQILVTSMINSSAGYYNMVGTSKWITGAPFTVGTKLYFVYDAYAGGYDGTGTHDYGLATTDGFLSDSGDGLQCIPNSGGAGGTKVTAANYGAPNAPTGKYDFVMLTAWSTLKSSILVGDVFDLGGGSFKSCFFVTQMISTNNNGDTFRETPLVQYQIDPNP